MDEEEGRVEGSAFWICLTTIFICVVVAGAMAGLTIGLFSLDRLGLEVLIRSGHATEKRYASLILPLVKKEHLLLVTLLLCNAIANEALPIFLDKLLSPVWAIVVSVSLVLVFGEIIPQAVFKEHSLCVGAFLAPVVHVLMFVCYPIAWPISKLLDNLLGSGEEEEVEYERQQLKTFVRLHGKHEGRGGVLTPDETTMIDGVLELSEKRASDVMVPISMVFTLSEDTVLDRETLKNISRSGHSRIPIYRGSTDNLIGILLVKALINEDLQSTDPPCIRDLTLHSLPMKDSSTPLFQMLDFFQEGKSHLVLLSSSTNSDTGTKIDGIITLEDVVEELIKEEIYDETDMSPTNDGDHFAFDLSPKRKGSGGTKPIGTVKQTSLKRSSREKNVVDSKIVRSNTSLFNGSTKSLNKMQGSSSTKNCKDQDSEAENIPLMDLMDKAFGNDSDLESQAPSQRSSRFNSNSSV